MNKKSLASYLILITIFALLPSGVFGAAVQNTNPVGTDQSPTLTGNMETGELVWVNNVLQVRTKANGTGSVRPLQIKTGANTGLYMDASGNVGIGTATPAAELDVNGVIRSGGTYTNVVSDISCISYVNGVKIKTNIPFTNGPMQEVIIEGHDYSGAKTVGVGLAWHTWAGAYIALGASSWGGTAPPIKLATENGLTTITLTWTPYCAKISVRVIGAGNASWFDGWTIVDEAAGTTNQTAISYSNYFPGSVNVGGTVTAGGFSGPMTGSLGAPYITSGIFGSTSGKGNYTFEAAANTNNVLKVDATNERIGIGTASPADKLAVAGNIIAGNRGQGIYLSDQGVGTTNYGEFLGATANGGVLQLGNNGPNEIRAGNTGTGGYLRFIVNNTAAPTSATNGTVAMTILSGGNVGIGTTAPVSLLGLTHGIITVGQGVNDKAELRGGTGFGSSLRLYEGTGGTETVRLDAGGAGGISWITSGNVGIGTASPSYKLDVSGEFRASAGALVAGRFISTSDYQLLLQSSDTWTGFAFDDSGTVNDYIWYNGGAGTFAIGGGGANVTNKKLHVNGGMTVGSGYSGTAVSPNSLVVEGSVTATGGFSGAMAGSLGAAYITPGSFGSTSGKGNYVFEAAGNNNNVLKVDASNERVGIGTASPSYKLHVVQPYVNSNHPLLISNSSYPNSYTIPLYDTAVLQQDDVTALRLVEYNNGGTNQELGIGVGDGYSNITASVPMRFWAGSTPGSTIYNGAAGTLAMTILANGNIGIGPTATSPGYKLDIQGSAWNNIARIYSTGSSSGLDFFDTNGTRRGVVYSDASGFGLLGSGTGWAVRIPYGTNNVVFENGSVGIGTASTGERLEVNGNIKFSDSLLGQGGKYITSLPWFNCGGGCATGYVKLVTPIVHNESNMFNLHIVGYDYGSAKGIDTNCYGYAYSGSTLINSGCQSTGNATYPIEMGVENRSGTSYVVVRIGTPSSTWYFQHFTAEYRGWSAKSASGFSWVSGETTPVQTGNTHNALINDQSGTATFSGPIAIGSPQASNHATTKSYVDSILGLGGSGTSTASFDTIYVAGTSTLAATKGKVIIGGAGPSLKLDVTGQGQLTDTISATKYYDYNDPTYYVDPANTGTALKFNGAMQAEGTGVNYLMGQLGVGASNPGTHRFYVGNGTSYFNNSVSINGTLSMVASSSIAMGFGAIGAVGKLTVQTIDPLYEIDGEKYSTFASSIAGGVKEEYIGRAKLEPTISNSKFQISNEESIKIQNLKLKNSEPVYSYVIDFDSVPKGSDLWVWYQAVDFNKKNVEALVTAYDSLAKIGYKIDGKKLIFFGDEETEFSFRLIGNRHDWKNWPTYSKDQKETPSFILKAK